MAQRRHIAINQSGDGSVFLVAADCCHSWNPRSDLLQQLAKQMNMGRCVVMMMVNPHHVTSFKEIEMFAQRKTCK